MRLQKSVYLKHLYLYIYTFSPQKLSLANLISTLDVTHEEIKLSKHTCTHRTELEGEGDGGAREGQGMGGRDGGGGKGSS